MKEQKRANKLFRRLTRKLRVELLESRAFRLLKQKSRPRDGSYRIMIDDGLSFSMHILGSFVLITTQPAL